MIEVKNLVKVYKPKKGVPVRAVDGVSLKIEEKGMVFILGKSGSGKSTLLNLLGGLDRYDEGEIIIKGKSSKDFSQSEFDSYRNTYLGFIFQEYNILNDFSVGANIALAMELQGKKATNEALNDLLKTVDLEGYAHRKPNELSGGQKQRVAIARALIKNPEIIMADEPTGALDSNTGKQVFETLQKLSKEKLVIIISHDREFAEYYGDRVIEMADGKIISDIKKYKAGSDVKSEGISVIDDKILHIKKGYQLTTKDLKLINEYVSQNTDSDTLISIDSKANLDFRKQARIDDNGQRDAFQDTKDADITVKEYKKGDFKLIKSRLPVKNAVKIGASSLKAKPFRLVLTILLSAVALVLFGIAATAAAYNKVDASVQSITDKSINYVAFQKSEEEVRGDDSWFSDVQMTESDLATIAAKYPDTYFFPVIAPGQLSLSFVQSIYNTSNIQSNSYPQYYQTQFSGLTAMPQEGMQEMGYSLVAGRLPVADDEIAITKFTLESFEEGGYADYLNTDNSLEEGVNANTILGKNIYISYATADTTGKKIVGVIDTGFDSARYDALKPSDAQSSDMGNYMLGNEYTSVVNTSFHNLVFVSADTFADINKDKTSGAVVSTSVNMNFSKDEDFMSTFGSSVNIYKPSMVEGVLTPHYFDSTKTTLADGEVIVSLSILQNYYDWQDAGFQSFAPYDWSAMEAFANEYLTIDMYQSAVAEGLYLKDDFISEEDNFANFKMQVGGSLTTYISSRCSNLEVTETSFAGVQFEPAYQEYLTGIYQQAKTFVDTYLATFYAKIGWNVNDPKVKLKIVGVYDNLPSSNGIVPEIMTMSNASYASLGLDQVALYSTILSRMPDSASDISNIVEFSYEVNDGVQYELVNASSSSLNTINGYVEMFTEIFVYIGIGFAVFAALMLMNYIATSITYKKREIGILRAVGARGADVFSIFFSEAFIISLINFAIALVATIVAVIAINGLFANTLNMLISILSFGILQGLMMLGISVGSAFVASLVPVISIASKKPIDAIQNR